jgi:flavorubredoxin
MTTVEEIREELPPRELLPGLWRLGQCVHYPFEGTVLHGHNSMHVLAGETSTAVVDGGLPADIPVLERQVAALIEEHALPPIKYLFATHTETPHCSAFGRMLQHYPDAVLCGDVTDLHLTFPAFADRLVPLEPGDSLDLGGTELQVVEPVLRDYNSTVWGFDTSRRVLFSADGLSYSHYHQVGQCNKVVEEAPELDVPNMASLFAELAFYWTKFVDLEPYIERVNELIFDELDVAMIASTHGLPIADPVATMPKLVEGLRIGARERALRDF